MMSQNKNTARMANPGGARFIPIVAEKGLLPEVDPVASNLPRSDNGIPY